MRLHSLPRISTRLVKNPKHEHLDTTTTTTTTFDRKAAISSAAVKKNRRIFSTRASIPEQERSNSKDQKPAGFDVSSKVFPVTGAGGGLGLAQARYLAEHGAQVYCLDVKDAPSDQWLEVQASVAEQGKGGMSYIQLDVTSHQQQHSVMATIADMHDGIDGGYFAAGINHVASLLDYAPGMASKVMDINFHGVLYSIQACAKQMIKHKKTGCLVPVASMSARVANRGLCCAPYNASKAAVVSLVQTSAAELAQYGIRVNAVLPGNCLTPMIRQNFQDQPRLEQEMKSQNMLGRLSVPEEYNGTILYLLSDASTYMTGSAVTVDGGYTAW